MKILVVGGAGFIGSHLVRALSDRDHQVAVIDGFRFNYLFPPSRTQNVSLAYRASDLLRGAPVFRCDLFHRERLKLLVVRFEPDCVVNLACLPLANVAEEFEEEARQSILDGACAMIEASLCYPRLRRFVQVSSSMVYGDFERDPNPEEASKAPKSTYGRYKLESEQLVRDLVGAAGREHVIVRPSGVYGPTDINNRVVQIFCEKALVDEQITVNRSETTIDFTWIEDIASGLALAATHENAANETFNMASGRGRSLAELVNILRVHFPDLAAEVRSQADPTVPNRGGLDISKAGRLLGYAPTMQLETGVSAYLKFLQQHGFVRRITGMRRETA